MRGRRVAVDVYARQIIAMCALASSLLCTAVCIGMAVALWSDWLVILAAVPAVAGAVVSVVAIPSDPMSPHVAPVVLGEGDVVPLNTWTRLEFDGLQVGDRIVISPDAAGKTTTLRVDP